MNRLPKISVSFRILVICEGSEEYEYMEKLKSLALWNDKYSFSFYNADGNGNIPAIYQEKFSNDFYDCILIFCDTDKAPYKIYKTIKDKINLFRGKKVSGNVIMFGNPCTLQILLLHFDDGVRIKSANKRKNAPIIKHLLGIEGYDAREDQRNEILSMVNADNYKKMKERVKKLPHDDSILCSSNFDIFMAYFESSDHSWIKKR